MLFDARHDALAQHVSSAMTLGVVEPPIARR
jgi:hypothetical protein